MDLKECYAGLGGNYDEVMGRLRREQMVQKFVFKFLEDKSYALLEESMAAGHYEEALRAVHTLKGVCQNLSFTKLYETSNRMTGLLRGGQNEEAAQMMGQIGEDYAQTVRFIQEFRQSQEG